MAEDKKIKAPKLKALSSTAKSPKYDSEEGRTFDPRPVIEVTEDDLPEITKWPIDGKYRITCEVEMKGIHESDYGHTKGKKVAKLKVIKIASNGE